MYKIHHVESTPVEHYVVDPNLGPMRRVDQIVRRSSTESIVYKGETYKIQPDGCFDVPEDVAQFMCRQPNWNSGPCPFPPEDAPAADDGAESRRGPGRPRKVTDAE